MVYKLFSDFGKYQIINYVVFSSLPKVQYVVNFDFCFPLCINYLASIFLFPIIDHILFF